MTVDILWLGIAIALGGWIVAANARAYRRARLGLWRRGMLHPKGGWAWEPDFIFWLSRPGAVLGRVVHYIHERRSTRG